MGRKYIFQSLFWIYLIASGITFYFLYEGNRSAREQYHKQLTSYTTKLDSISKLEQFNQELVAADEYFISGNYDSAALRFNQLLTHTSITDISTKLIQLRLTRIEEITNQKDTLFSDLKTFQFIIEKLNIQKDSMRYELDSISNVLSEVENNFESQVEEFKLQLAQKEKALSRKERVQVISFRNEKGNLVHYLGEVSNGKANGGGIGIWDTGGIYRGEWKDNQRHGEGIYEWKDGHRYEGEYETDMRQGQGTYYWSSGEKYEGEWKNSKRNGNGVLFDKNNNISYQGLWKDDKIIDK
jgi:hypothetical protein